MLPLIIITYGVFLVFWLADIYFTYTGVKRLGVSVEVNPLLHSLMKIRRKFLGLFKLIEITLFSYLVWQLSQLDEELLFNILMGVILFYSLIVAAGIKVYVEVSDCSTPVVLFFLVVSLVLVLLIYLNHMEYVNRGILADSLNDCGKKYASLYTESSVGNESGLASPQDYSLLSEALRGDTI